MDLEDFPFSLRFGFKAFTNLECFALWYWLLDCFEYLVGQVWLIGIWQLLTSVVNVLIWMFYLFCLGKWWMMRKFWILLLFNFHFNKPLQLHFNEWKYTASYRLCLYFFIGNMWKDRHLIQVTQTVAFVQSGIPVVTLHIGHPILFPTQ